ncbi:TPA: hypothetical protein ACNFPK_002540 [Citrobacter freundii]
MKTSTKIIWGIVLVASYFHFKDEKKTTTKSEPQEQTVKMTAQEAQEAQDAKDFAQSLIQSRGYKCDKVTTFSNANFSGRIDIYCDDQYRYEITKPGGRWEIKAIN